MPYTEKRQPHLITSENLPLWLTVTISTSPIVSHPSTSLIEETIASFYHVKHLSRCPRMIICDGYKVRPRSKFRSGEITIDRATAYEDYKKTLRELSLTAGSILAGSTVLELQERNGFGYALREGIARITTPYVLVVQHDRNFRANGFRLLDAVQAMHTHRAWLHYIGLPTSRTIKHRTLVLSKYNVRLASFTVRVHEPKFTSTDKEAAMSGKAGRACNSERKGTDMRYLHLTPLIQWYDSTHLASTMYYRDFVFSCHVKRVARGGFIEDKLGQEQLRVILERGMSAHVRYGTFILTDESEEPVVQHLDGHDPRNSKRFVLYKK